MIEGRVLGCALEYPCVTLFCIGRRGEGLPSTSHMRQNYTSLGMVVDICIPRHFGGSDWTPNSVDYDIHKSLNGGQNMHTLAGIIITEK